MRILHGLAYLWFIVAEVVKGSAQVVAMTLIPSRQASPCIVEVPTRCRSDLEIAAFASSITITPGTLVVGVAADDGDVPPTLFVHSIFSADRDEVLAGLRDMESRLLRATRKGK